MEVIETKGTYQIINLSIDELNAIKEALEDTGKDNLASELDNFLNS